MRAAANLLSERLRCSPGLQVGGPSVGLDAWHLSGFVSPVASSVMAALKWADRRRLALLNTLIVPFIVGPVVTPLLLAGGATSTATAFYRFFHLLCHQWAFRSFFVLGTQATYSRDQLSALGVDPYSFVGDAQMGWKMAFCERNLAIFVACWHLALRTPRCAGGSS